MQCSEMQVQSFCDKTEMFINIYDNDWGWSNNILTFLNDAFSFALLPSYETHPISECLNDIYKDPFCVIYCFRPVILLIFWSVIHHIFSIILVLTCTNVPRCGSAFPRNPIDTIIIV